MGLRRTILDRYATGSPPVVEVRDVPREREETAAAQHDAVAR